MLTASDLFSAAGMGRPPHQVSRHALHTPLPGVHLPRSAAETYCGEPVTESTAPYSDATTGSVTESSASSSDASIEPVTESSSPSNESPLTEGGVVPGEGSCLVDGTTYADGADVPTSSHCQLGCVCRGSVVNCETRKCPVAPEGSCRPFYQKGSCCPDYDCGE